MHVAIARRVRADPDTLFRLVAAVEDWPRILPHYRFVRVLRDTGAGQRLVEMAARRDLLPDLLPSGWFQPFIPLRWTAVQALEPAGRRITFEHVGGPSRGMRVAWTFEPESDGRVRVEIHHVFEPAWGVPDAIVRLVVGEYLVNGVAGRTLRHIARLAEVGS